MPQTLTPISRALRMQGTQMNREMFSGRFFVPSASLALFNILSIVTLIPVYDRIFVPLMQRFGRKLTLLQRIGVRTFVS